MANDDITILGTGDIGPDRDDPGTMFRHVTDVIKSGDISFCHLEICLSNRGVGPHANDVAKDPIIAAEIISCSSKFINLTSLYLILP